MRRMRGISLRSNLCRRELSADSGFCQPGRLPGSTTKRAEQCLPRKGIRAGGTSRADGHDARASSISQRTRHHHSVLLRRVSSLPITRIAGAIKHGPRRFCRRLQLLSRMKRHEQDDDPRQGALSAGQGEPAIPCACAAYALGQRHRLCRDWKGFVYIAFDAFARRIPGSSSMPLNRRSTSAA